MIITELMMTVLFSKSFPWKALFAVIGLCMLPHHPAALQKGSVSVCWISRMICFPGMFCLSIGTDCSTKRTDLTWCIKMQKLVTIISSEFEPPGTELHSLQE